MAFTVRSTDERFLELLRRYLLEFRVDDGPDDYLYQADCGKERVLPGGKVVRGKAFLYLGSLRIYGGALWEEMAGRLISSVRDLVTAHSNEFLRVRAVGVEVGGAATILPSAPNPHLPALAAMLVRAGARYLGDETVNIDPVLHRVHGLRLPLLLDTRDLVHFPELPRPRGRSRLPDAPEKLGAKTPRVPVRLGDLAGGDGVAGPSPLRGIVFPEFRPGARTELRPLGASEGLFQFVEAALNLHIWTDRGLVLMRQLLEEAGVRRLVVGSLPEAADLLLASLSDPSSPDGG